MTADRLGLTLDRRPSFPARTTNLSQSTASHPTVRCCSPSLPFPPPVHTCCMQAALGVESCFGLFFTALQQDPSIGADRASLAWIQSIATFLELFLGLVAGWATAKFGARAVTLAGGVSLSLGLFLSASAQSVAALYVFYSGLVGVGMALSYGAASIAVGQYFTTRRAFANGISMTGSGAGTMVLSRLVGAMLKSTDWRSCLRVLAVMSAVMVGVGALLLVPVDQHGEELVDEEGEEGAAAAGGGGSGDPASSSAQPAPSASDDPDIPEGEAVHAWGSAPGEGEGTGSTAILTHDSLKGGVQVEMVDVGGGGGGKKGRRESAGGGSQAQDVGWASAVASDSKGEGGGVGGGELRIKAPAAPASPPLLPTPAMHGSHGGPLAAPFTPFTLQGGSAAAPAPTPSASRRERAGSRMSSTATPAAGGTGRRGSIGTAGIGRSSSRKGGGPGGRPDHASAMHSIFMGTLHHGAGSVAHLPVELLRAMRDGGAGGGATPQSFSASKSSHRREESSGFRVEGADAGAVAPSSPPVAIPMPGLTPRAPTPQAYPPPPSTTIPTTIPEGSVGEEGGSSASTSSPAPPPEAASGQVHGPAGGKAHAHGAKHEPVSTKVQAYKVLHDASFWAVAVSMAMIVAPLTLTSIHLGSYASLDSGYGAEYAADLYFAIGLAGVLGRVATAFFLLRYEVDLLFLLQLYAAATGLALSGLSLYGGSKEYLMFNAVVYGALGGSTFGLVPPVLASTFGIEGLPFALGGTYTVRAPVVLLAGPIGGWIRDWRGSYADVWLVGGFIVVTSALPLALMHCTCQRRGAQGGQGSGGVGEGPEEEGGHEKSK